MIENLSIKEIKEKLLKGELTSYELTSLYLDRIKMHEKEIGAFITLDEEKALESAKESDSRRKKGEKVGYLEGIPVILKDNICTKDFPTTCASKMLEGYMSPFNATVVERLLEEGMIILGKSNMDEFAMGSSTEKSYFKKTKNPWDKERVPGGSSGGSIAGVAAGFSPLALGSDTGGSVRQPSAYCGTVGLKPTYGAVSRYGLVAFGSSLDQIGPTAKKVEDIAMSMNVIAGYDKKDTTSINKKWDDFTKDIGKSVKGMKIALPEEFYGDGIDSDILKEINNVIEILKSNGAEITKISTQRAKDALAVYYILASAEASSNLARYDGIRFGYKTDNYTDLNSMYKNTRSEGFGAEVKNRIMLGTYVLSSGYYDAYYKKALEVRALIRKEYKEVFSNYDLIITPTTPTTAFKFDENSNDPIKMYMNDICTVPVNVAGVPAMSMPVGFDRDGLPIGMQIIANHENEYDIFRVGAFIEKERNILNSPKMEVK